MTEVNGPLPDNLGELIGALVTIVLSIIAAFKRGKKVGAASRDHGQ